MIDYYTAFSSGQNFLWHYYKREFCLTMLSPYYVLLVYQCLHC